MSLGTGSDARPLRQPGAWLLVRARSLRDSRIKRRTARSILVGGLPIRFKSTSRRCWSYRPSTQSTGRPSPLGRWPGMAAASAGAHRTSSRCAPSSVKPRSFLLVVIAGYAGGCRMRAATGVSFAPSHLRRQAPARQLVTHGTTDHRWLSSHDRPAGWGCSSSFRL